MSSDLNEPLPDYQPIGIGILIGAVLVAAIWGAFALLSGDGDDEDRSTTPPAGLSSLPGSAPSTDPQDVLDVCRTVVDAQGEVLDAARRAMNQWEVHIEAMNQLVVGALTLDQATAFWDRTRVGAKRRLATFRTAYDGFDSRTVRCPPPSADRTGTAALPPCQQAAAGRTRVLRLADDALRTWRRHVRHMEMLRHGHITPAEATAEWLASWQEGNEQVRVYRAAARRTNATSC